MEDNPWGGVVALILGTILVVLVMLGLAKLISKRKGNGPE
jgi:cobalt/nickel transport protein